MPCSASQVLWPEQDLRAERPGNQPLHPLGLDRRRLLVVGGDAQAAGWPRHGRERLFADDTPLPVLDPGRGWTKTGRLWAYTRDDRSYGSNIPDAVVFHYAPDRTGARPAEHLKKFRGILRVDGYAGFEVLADRGAVTLAACWAHARRKFFERHEAGSPVAPEAVQRIGELYEIEATIRTQPPDERLRVRQQQSLPLVEVLQAWLELQLSRLPGRSRLAEAIRYALGRWSALTRFLADGRIDLDTNPVERAIRPIALGRKNSLFAGSEGGAKSARSKSIRKGAPSRCRLRPPRSICPECYSSLAT